MKYYKLKNKKKHEKQRTAHKRRTAFIIDKGAKLVISSYDGAESKTYDAPVEESKLDISSSALKKDILTISLFVDSKLADSISFNNK